MHVDTIWFRTDSRICFLWTSSSNCYLFMTFGIYMHLPPWQLLTALTTAKPSTTASRSRLFMSGMLRPVAGSRLLGKLENVIFDIAWQSWGPNRMLIIATIYRYCPLLLASSGIRFCRRVARRLANLEVDHVQILCPRTRWGLGFVQELGSARSGVCCTSHCDEPGRA